MSERRTIDTAPVTTDDDYKPVLLWVRGGGDDGRGAWAIDIVFGRPDGTRKAVIPMHRGAEVPYWEPLPEAPE